MTRVFSLATTLLLVLGVATARANPPPQVEPEDPLELHQEIATKAGKLETWANMFKTELRMDGRVLFVHEGIRLVIVEPKTPTQQVLLLRTPSGGSACPMEYRVLDLSDPKRLLLTASVGTCSDLERKIEVGADGRSLDWQVHSFTSDKDWVKFRYKDGVLSSAEKGKWNVDDDKPAVVPLAKS